LEAYAGGPRIHDLKAFKATTSINHAKIQTGPTCISPKSTKNIASIGHKMKKISTKEVPQITASKLLPELPHNVLQKELSRNERRHNEKPTSRVLIRLLCVLNSFCQSAIF